MKKSVFAGAIVSIVLGTIANAQVTTPTNLSPAGGTPFLGWSGAGPGGARNLDIRNNYNLPINFFTNSLQRISLTNTGSFALGLNFNNPLSLMHIDGNGYNNGEVFRTDGPAATLNAWRMETGGVPRASFYTRTNNNVFIETESDNAIFGVITGGPTLATGLRMLVRNDGNGGANGRTAFGDDLPETFNPQDRLHLHHVTGASNVRIRFSYDGTTTDGIDNVGSGALDGTVIGIDVNGEYRIIQHEDRPIRYYIPDAGVKTGVPTRAMKIVPGGRTYIGQGDPVLSNRFSIESVLTGTGPDATPSGLRLVNLPSTSATVANPGIGVLAVDQNGNVIYVNQNSGIVGTASNGVSIASAGANAGDVVFGQRFGEAGNPGELYSNREVPLNGGTILFTDNGNGTSFASNVNRIGIGIDQNVNPLAKLHLLVDNPGTGFQDAAPAVIRAEHISTAAPNKSGAEILVQNGSTINGMTLDVNSGTLRTTGIDVEVADGAFVTGLNVSASDGTNRNEGVISVCSVTGTNYNSGRSVAFNGDASGSSSENFGCFVTAGALTNNSATVRNYGIWAVTSGNALEAFGGRFQGNGGTLANYGIRAGTQGTGATDFAGYFDGNVYVTGVISLQNGTLTLSDQNYKTDVNPILNGKSLVDQLNPVSFYFDTLNNDGFRFASGKHYGFVAQEVEQILPDLVIESLKAPEYDSLGNQIEPAHPYKSLNYDGFIAILTQAIQEQQDEIDDQQTAIDNQQVEIQEKDSLINDLNARLTLLENCLANAFPNLCSMNQGMIQQNDSETQDKIKVAMELELVNDQVVTLSQNVPNPFAESTEISYFIPELIQEAKMRFFNQQGLMIKEVIVKDRGNGSIRVFGQNLSEGVYSYQLVVDGQAGITKKMLKQ
ncbi:MAG: tail fiber domain-containing protein [Bacteroidetes bacterium]|nr:MAG: tail fiber domain-containing protein [Bacteroidota bacterium]